LDFLISGLLIFWAYWIADSFWSFVPLILFGWWNYFLGLQDADDVRKMIMKEYRQLVRGQR